MALFLLEFGSSAGSRDDVRALLQRVAEAVGRVGGEFIEAQVPNDPVSAAPRSSDNRKLLLPLDQRTSPRIRDGA